MRRAIFDEREQHAAFVKAAQYLMRLRPNQDVFEHLAGVVTNFFKADWVAFARQEAEAGLVIELYPEAAAAFRGYLLVASRDVVAGVMESGFMAVEIFALPEPYTTVCLPIHASGQTTVALIGYASAEPLTRDLLNLFLALSGMAEAAIERMLSERELRRHRDNLEELVKERTAEVEFKNMRLTEEVVIRKEVEESLRRSEEQIRLLLNSTAEAMYAVDLNGNCTFCNTACLRLLGYLHPDDLLGKNMHQLIHYKYADETPASIEECRMLRSLQHGEGVHLDDEVFWQSNGTSFPIEYWSHPLSQDGTIIGAVITFLDITERKKSEKENRNLAMTDSLTGLYNRRGFLSHSRQQFQALAGTNNWISLVYVDMDGLKRINDTWGHLEGDKLLLEACSVLLETFRETDIVARLGGDEFAVLLKSNAEIDPAVLNQRLQSCIDKHNMQAGRIYRLEMSYGVAQCGPGNNLPLDELIVQADALMYENKQRKKSRPASGNQKM